MKAIATALFAVLAFAASVNIAAQDVPPPGTWKLVKRTLPDGKVLTPPAVNGYFSVMPNGTYHLTVFWQTPDGKTASRGHIVQNKFSENELVATQIAGVFDDGSGKPVVYDPPGVTKIAPIKREGGRISYQHPFAPPFIVWEGDVLTASVEKGPVDVWERVK